jgi:recombination protein RecR
MYTFPLSMQKLIRELSKLPSIGEKTATRLAYYLVQQEPAISRELAEALVVASKSVRLCNECFFFSEGEKCTICADVQRDRAILCVVEKPVDVVAIERMGEFRGLYHVLHGVWSPLRGMGPEKLKIDDLVLRTKTHEVKEVILATSATVEGDATAIYLARSLGGNGTRVTRLAQGIPKGGELEYADDITLSRAMMGRSVVE